MILYLVLIVQMNGKLRDKFKVFMVLVSVSCLLSEIVSSLGRIHGQRKINTLCFQILMDSQ